MSLLEGQKIVELKNEKVYQQLNIIDLFGCFLVLYLVLVPSGVVLLQNRDLEQVLRVTVEEVLVELPENALRHPAFLPLPPPLPAPWPRGLGMKLLLLLLLWTFLDGGRWPLLLLLLLLLLLFDFPDKFDEVDVALGAGLAKHHAQKSGGKITVRQSVC